MRKFYLLLFSILSLSLVARADFNIWASAVYLNVNGTAAFYNTQVTAAPFAIGNTNFTGSLGIFGRNSGTLKLLGAEINTAKTGASNICNGGFYYTVYKQGQRPAIPVFSTFGLHIYCACNGTMFNDCGGRACNNINEQKLQSADESIDLTNFETGDYVLEIYYEVNGNETGIGCNQHRTDNVSNANYTASFSITAPLSINFVSLSCTDTYDGILIKWVVQDDVDIVKYEIERSGNGLNFSSINSIPSRASSGTSRYLGGDIDPIIGTNFYRLKATHQNGSVSFSKIFRAYFGKISNTIFIHANPSATELSVHLVAVARGNYNLSVLNTNGQTLVSMRVQHDGTDRIIKINLPVTAPKGIYRLFLIDKIQFYKQSFLVR